MLGKGHSAEYAVEFYRLPDVKGILLHFASWAGVEVGNSQMYWKEGGKKKGGKGERSKPSLQSSVWLAS